MDTTLFKSMDTLKFWSPETFEISSYRWNLSEKVNSTYKTSGSLGTALSVPPIETMLEASQISSMYFLTRSSGNLIFSSSFSDNSPKISGQVTDRISLLWAREKQLFGLPLLESAADRRIFVSKTTV